MRHTLIHYYIFIIATFLSISVCNAKVTYAQPLKILVAVTYFPPAQGAAVVNQITGLLDAGFDVRIYSKKKGAPEDANDEYYTYKLYDKVYYEQIPYDIDTYDIIYAQTGYRGRDFVDIKKRRGDKVSLITCFRGADLDKYLNTHPHAYDELFKVGDLFLPVCHYFENILIKEGCSKNKIKVHHSAIDLELFKYQKHSFSKNKKIRLVSVSRLIEKKGLTYLIQAVKELISQGYDVEYTVVGDGDLLQSLQQEAHQLGIAQQVKFVGSKLLKEVAAILHESDIFVLPSVTAQSGDREGIPNALKEAMACGIPVISTHNSGIPELIEDKKSGLLVPCKNVKALAKAISYLINNPQTSAKMGYEGYCKIKAEYDRQAINKKLIIYLYAIQDKKSKK